MMISSYAFYTTLLWLIAIEREVFFFNQTGYGLLNDRLEIVLGSYKVAVQVAIKRMDISKDILKIVVTFRDFCQISYFQKMKSRKTK